MTVMRDATETIEVPLDLLFNLLEQLFSVVMRLDPPEDYKPWKHHSGEEEAARLYSSYLRLQLVMAASLGVTL